MRKRLGSGGFTLVELGVTVAIIGVLAAVAVPNIKGFLPRVRLGTATQTLSNELAMARMAAIAKGFDGKAVIDKDSESYSLYRRKTDASPYASATLPAAVLIEDFTYYDGSNAPSTVQINANGTMGIRYDKQAVVITLATKDGAHKRRVLIWATGRVNSERWRGGNTWEAD